MSKTMKLCAHLWYRCLLVAGFLLYCSSVPAQELPAASLTKVRALVYSTTAAELQWSRRASERVQVSYNGEVLGLFDANSLYRGNLDPRTVHRFVLRTLSPDNRLSSPVTLSFTSGDFKPPIRQILPGEQALGSGSSSSSGEVVSTDASESAATGGASLSDVRAQVYSTTAAELLWSRNTTDRVRISYNGRNLGSLDTSSLFQAGLDPNVQHRYELVALDENGTAGSRHVLEFSTLDFDGQVRTIKATGTAIATPEMQQPSQPVAAPLEDAPDAVAAPQAPVDIAAPEPDDIAPPEPDVIAPQVPTTVTPQAPIPEEPPVPVRSDDCVVRSVAQLSSCVQAAAGFSRINVQADLTCSGAACCPAGGALIDLSDVNDLSIVGNGHRLLRTSGQRQCSLLDIDGASSISIRNWHLDDDARVQPCQVTDRCPRTLHIRNSSDISLEGVSIVNGKSYVIYVQRVNGFRFVNSSLKNSGVLGLYVGHSEMASTNVRIQHSTFTDNQTNALALLGVTGATRDTNIISNNVFRRNHYRGQFPVAARYGTGFTGGGQVYIAQATGLTIRDNTIADGYCENCFVQQRHGTGVSGIELAMPGRNSVSNVLITNNAVSNHDAWGIFVNQGSALDASIEITNNRLLDNTTGLKPSGARTSGNVIRDR